MVKNAKRKPTPIELNFAIAFNEMAMRALATQQMDHVGQVFAFYNANANTRSWLPYSKSTINTIGKITSMQHASVTQTQMKNLYENLLRINSCLHKKLI
jgi:hypothetical protein